jgi:FtsH-binding integral membrane protein
MVIVSAGVFFLVYVGIIKGLPILMKATSWWGFVLLVTALAFGAWHAHRERDVLLNTVLMSLLLVVIGYTSYGMIYVRAQASPPINENNPSTPETFFSYLNREQYGDMPLLPRRWSPEPVHQYYYQQYSSDLDFFLRYQMEKMYFRYFGWQFIGREHDLEGSGVDWSVLWGLPFLSGLFGAAAHFRRNWKMGMFVAALFVLTGAALVIYLNQTEPQPRERDYSYAGSFFAFALWIGIGIECIWQKLAEYFGKSGRKAWLFPAALVTVTAGMVLIDGRMLQANYKVHNRSGNYVPWDWAWNILQSCEKDAILFTNGDNDTFPLWYLQEVERIRTDVRVVNLSLANTGWYLAQLKKTEPRGAKRITFSMSDDEIADITYEPVDSMEVALPALNARQQLLLQSRQHGVRLPLTPADSITWMLRPGLVYDGQGYFRPQDKAVYDIVMSNFADRPVYFALTVDPENMIGIENFLRLDGLVYKVVPLKSPDPMSFVDSSLLYGNLAGIYRYRNLNNPAVYLEETSRRLCGNYSPLFVRLALELAADPGNSIRISDGKGGMVTVRQGALALRVLDKSSRLFPLSQYPVNPELAGSVISLYVRLGEKQKATPYIGYLEELGRDSSPSSEPKLYFVLARAYRNVGRSEDARRVISRLAKELNQPGLIREFETMKD